MALRVLLSTCLLKAWALGDGSMLSLSILVLMARSWVYRFVKGVEICYGWHKLIFRDRVVKVVVGGFILMGVTRLTLDTVWGHWKVVNQVDSSMGHAVG